MRICCPCRCCGAGVGEGGDIMRFLVDYFFDLKVMAQGDILNKKACLCSTKLGL